MPNSLRRWITYFVREPMSGAVKIGRTFEGSDRMKDLQRCNPGTLEVIAVFRGDVEHEMHHKLAAHRIRGEWFRPHADLLAVVAMGDDFHMVADCIYLPWLPGESKPEHTFTRPLSSRHAKLGKRPGRGRMLGILNSIIKNPKYSPTKRGTELVLSRLIRLGFVIEAEDGTHWATLKATGGISEDKLETEGWRNDETLRKLRPPYVPIDSPGDKEEEKDG